MKKISIIDSGLSNIYNVCQAFKYIGMNVDIIESADDKLSDYLVLPGVGSFENGLSELYNKKLIESIKKHIKGNKPFLGICLGMQMMLEQSKEFGNFNGIGIIQGEVIKIPHYGKYNLKHKIPHIGWNKNIIKQNGTQLLQNVSDGTATYFVHSYMAQPTNKENIIATCDYNGVNITSIIRHGNSYGCQFHPEKSGENGLKILTNFANL